MLIPAPWDERSLTSDFERGETLVTGPHNKGKKNSGGRKIICFTVVSVILDNGTLTAHAVV